MGESNLERNALEIYKVCRQDGVPISRARQIAEDYARTKADAIQDFFGRMTRVEELPSWKREEYEYRRGKAIPDALDRTERKLGEISRETEDSIRRRIEARM